MQGRDHQNARMAPDLQPLFAALAKRWRAEGLRGVVKEVLLRLRKLLLIALPAPSSEPSPLPPPPERNPRLNLLDPLAFVAVLAFRACCSAACC